MCASQRKPQYLLKFIVAYNSDGHSRKMHGPIET